MQLVYPITTPRKDSVEKKEEPNMALTLGASNASSFRNMSYLRDAKSRMDNSLLRISSGKKILTAADDPGGLALSMRLNNELTLNNTIKNNVENSKSFVEMQDSALSTAADIITEMDRLHTSWKTASASDKSIYNEQFKELQLQLGSMMSEKFNWCKLV